MASGEVRRHFIIPDTQVKPGVPTDHINWIGEAIVEYRPDVVVHVGDHYDLPSLNGHEQPGSVPLEGKRYVDDIASGKEAFWRLDAPMAAEIKRCADKHRKRWNPRRVYLKGNHEARADRAGLNNPKFFGHIGSDNCESPPGWERHEYLEVVHIDGIAYSHFFQSPHSGKSIGGTVQNQISKIGTSFVHGHVQGLDMGTKLMANGRTLWGISSGSCYLHREDYRGAQGARHWNGVIVLNDARDGEFDPMPLSLRYLCRKYTGKDLHVYMNMKYPGMDWRHLQ